MVIVIGDSGTGKSSMIETLPPERTVIINTENKPLPIKNFGKYKNINITSYKKLEATIASLMKPEIKEKYDYVILDSFTSVFEIVNAYAAKVFAGYEVWAQYNEMIIKTIWDLKKLELQVFGIALPEQKAEQFGETKAYARIKGKELKYGFLEKEVAIVLFTNPVYDEDSGEMTDVVLDYKPNKFNSAKAPRGLFDKKPKNDALEVANAIKKFYGDS